MSAVSAMKWTPQKTIVRQSRLLGRHLAELVAVAPQVGDGDHLVLLIVMAQDQQLRPHFAADRLDPRGKLLVAERLVGLQLGERSGRGFQKRGHGCVQAEDNVDWS